MPAGKGSKAKKLKKEVLPPSSSFPDGHKNYYIGGWSSFSSLKEISSISSSLMKTYTGENREVATLPQTNVLILPQSVPDFTSVEAAAKAASTAIVADQCGSQRIVFTEESNDGSSSAPKEITELVVADKMQIEGVPYLTVKRSQQDRKEWIPPPKETIDDEKFGSRRRSSLPSKGGSGPKKKSGRQFFSSTGRGSTSSEKSPDERFSEEPQDRNASDPAAPAEEANAAPLPSTAEEKGQGGEIDKEKEEKEKICTSTLRAYEEELERLSIVETQEGALFSCRNAVMDGVIRFVGVLPQIVVKPILPAPPLRDDGTGGKKGRRKSNSTGSRSESMVAKAELTEASIGKKKGGAAKKANKDTAAGKKGGKKNKLTQEELEEIEKRMAEEDAKYLKDTEEAIEKAKEEEEYLMTFAHPNRWSHVTVTGVTFTGPVQVVRAHMKFLNCCFCSPYPNRPQFMVHQYCRVECVKCTFEEPRSSSVYALPASQITIRKCLFTGIAQRSLVEMEGMLPPLHSSASSIPKKALEKGENSENEEEEREGWKTVDKPLLSKGGEARELPNTPAVNQLIQKIQHTRNETVGIFTDCSKVLVEASRFLLLGFGSLFHGKYKVGRDNMLGNHSQIGKKDEGGQRSPTRKRQSPGKSGAKKDALAMLLSCQFQHLFGTGICVDRTANDVLIQGNIVSECDYYGLDLRQGSRNIRVYQNQFLHKAAVRIREGVHAQMLQNKHYSKPVDDNKKENPCLELHY